MTEGLQSEELVEDATEGPYVALFRIGQTAGRKSLWGSGKRSGK